MPTENHFRLAIVVIILLNMGIVLYHRLRAARSGEPVSRQQEGLLTAVVVRLAGLGLWAATFGYLLAPDALRWAALPLPTWLRLVGVAGGMACAALMYWTLASLGRNLTDTVAIREQATLVTHGPYRWVRHPFYVTAALLMASVTLAAANWLIGAMGLVVLMLLAIRTPQEEAMLIARFGDDYRNYMQRTGRFVPRPPPKPRLPD